MMLKKLLLAELPSLVVAAGLGVIFWINLGFYKGVLLFGLAFLVMQPFVLVPFFRKKKS